MINPKFIDWFFNFWKLSISDYFVLVVINIQDGSNMTRTICV